MVRVTGAVFVLFAAIGYAFSGVYRLKLKLVVFRQLTECMTFISSCIGFSQMPVREIFTKLSQRTNPQIASVFQHFLNEMAKKRSGSELWQESLSLLSGCLSDDEIAVFAPLGNSLGCIDAELQLKTIEMLLADAKTHEQRLVQRLDKYKAIDFKVTIMCGIMAVVLLI